VNDQTDSQLLRAYGEHRSEAAFAELVRRHVAFVHSAAVRMVCDSHLAQDVTQGVFVALAKNAGSLADRPVLSGWLHRTAQNIAAQTVRTDVRRRLREKEAAIMNELLTPDASWDQIAPELDAALGELNEPDRDALLLRYFEKKSAPEMAGLLGISEEAAQKRVHRAVDRLRELFSKRNVTIGTSGLVVLISANAVQAVPAAFATTITAAAVASTTFSTATVIATTKTIAMTTFQKSLVTATIAVCAGAGLFEAHQTTLLRDQIRSLEQQQSPLLIEIQQLQLERDAATNRLASSLLENHRSKSGSNNAELLKLRGEVTQLKAAEAQKQNDPIQAVAALWASRANQLKDWFQQMPGENIPELQLLSGGDWLHTVSSIDRWNGTNDLEFASSILRTRAKNTFVQATAMALIDYLVANQGQLPGDISAVKPYLPHPDQITDDMLARYKLLHAGNTSELSPDVPLVSEIAPAQSGQYDATFTFGAFGWSSRGVGPHGMNENGHIYSHHTAALKKLFKAP